MIQYLCFIGGDNIPTTTKITKEMILNVAFQITKTDGFDKVSNRTIAKKLNSSIRPIYYQFKNVDELNKELYTMIFKYFYKYIMNDIETSPLPYKQIGINYINFAKKENKLFQLLFMSDNKNFMETLTKQKDEFTKILDIIKKYTKLKSEVVENFHTEIWIFTHGIATLVANNTIDLTDEEISKLLSYEFQAHMLLKENPNNKWSNLGGHNEIQ